MNTIRPVLVAAVCAGVSAGGAFGQQEVYSHFTLPQTAGGAVTTPDWEVAEYVTLAGGAQNIGTVEVKFGALTPDGHGTLNLNLYDDANGMPGSLRATFSTRVDLVGTDPIVVTIGLGTYASPASVWVGARFVEESGGIAGVRVTPEPVTVGMVSSTRAFRQGGAGAWGTAPVTDWMTMHILSAACYANCDGSTAQPILNVNDFICFQSRFAAGDSYANCDGSTIPPVLNVNDFICFQGHFAEGCR